MKKLRFLFVFFLLCLLTGACKEAPSLQVAGPQTFTFPQEGGFQSITFSCNRDWRMTCTESWVELSKSAGAASDGETRVNFTVAPNTGYDARSANLTLEVADLTETFTITQEAGKKLGITPLSFHLTNAAQTIGVTVLQNVDYQIEIDKAAKGWISQSQIKALTEDKVSFDIAANPSFDDREGTIKFKQVGGSLVETVTVHQGQSYGLFITKPEYELSNQAHVLSVEVKANVDFEVGTQSDWIEIIENKALTTSMITLSVQANDSYDTRTGTVWVKQKDGDLGGIISVTQSPNEGLSVTPTDFVLTNQAQSVELTVRNNVPFSIVIPDEAREWIAVESNTQTRGLEEDHVVLSISKNPDFDAREASITFKQVDGPLAQTVSIRQDQTNGLFITTPEYVLSNEAHMLEVEVKANVEFEVTSEAEWIRHVETKSLKASTITLAVSANETYNERTGSVLVEQTNGNLSGIITVKQSPSGGLIVSPTSFELDAQAQLVEVTVSNNVPFSVVIPDEAREWIAVKSNTQTKALTEDKVVLSIGENPDFEAREASITFKQVDGPLAQTVSIWQDQTDGLFITTPEYELSNEAHTLEVEVKANVEFKVSSQADWIRYVETKSLKASTITLAVSENETFEERSGSVLVKQNNGSLSGTITVKQSPSGGLIISPTSFDLGNQAQSVEVTVQANVPFSVVIPSEARKWITLEFNKQTKALTEDKVVFSISENSSYEVREASITFKQVDGPLAQTVSIRQDQASGLTISPTSFELDKQAQLVEVKVRNNVPFDVVIPDEAKEWIAVESNTQTKALTEDIVVLSIGENSSFQAREASISFKQVDGPLAQTLTLHQEATPEPVEDGFIVVGYATYWESTMPDPALLTHINYAFALIKDDFETLNIKKDSRLKSVVALKNTNPQLKVLLSIGGWGAGNFSEMAADATHRKNFCNNCAAAVNQYKLDGIDLDWEYPTSSSAGISSSPDDTRNFTQLVKDLRTALGSGKLLTMASADNAKYVDFPSIISYLDYVNVMTYDMGKPPYHNAGLYKSSKTKRSCDESVQLHANAGVPYDKMTLGIPFYGHGNGSDFEEDVDFNEISYRNYTRCWDSSAQVPYLTNKSGEMVLSYDDESSVGLKAEYVKTKGLRGAMYWNIEADDANRTLSKAVAGPLLGWTAPDPGPEESFLATNQYVQKFLEEVNYPNTNNPDTDQEYSYSSIVGYPGGGPSENNIELPPTYTIKWTASSSGSQKLYVWEGDWSREYSLSSGTGSQDITNLVPGTTYSWEVSSSSGSLIASGSFKTTGLLRQVFFEPNVRNGRDLGGRTGLNGKTVAFHKLYRGGRIDGKYCNSNGRKEMLAEGIRAEVDLREEEDVPSSSPLGSSVDFYAPGFDSGYNHMVRDNPQKVKETFCWVVARLRENKPVYFHCAAGRDRTATLAVLLEGTLGVSESEMAKDYELTYFSPADWGMSKDDDGNLYYAHVRTAYSYKSIRKTIFNQTDSGTYQERIVKYLLKIGVPQKDIDDFRSMMLQ